MYRSQGLPSIPFRVMLGHVYVCDLTYKSRLIDESTRCIRPMGTSYVHDIRAGMLPDQTSEATNYIAMELKGLSVRYLHMLPEISPTSRARVGRGFVLGVNLVKIKGLEQTYINHDGTFHLHLIIAQLQVRGQFTWVKRAWRCKSVGNSMVPVLGHYRSLLRLILLLLLLATGHQCVCRDRRDQVM